MSEKNKNLFIGIVQKHMAMMKVKNYTQLARAIGMSSPTFYRRINDPDIRRMTKYLRIPVEELMEVWK